MGDEWLVDKEIDVDINQLQDFAKHIQAELDQNFKPSFEQGIKPMLTVQAPFGSGGMDEAKFFRGRHDESRSAAASMLADAMKGLVSLSMAASSIAAEYLTGDALAQATNDDVYKAFAGGPGDKTLDDYWKEAPEDKQPDGAVPEEARDLDKLLADHNHDGVPDADQSAGIYGETWIAKDTSGEYQIKADDQDLNNPALNVPTTSADH